MAGDLIEVRDPRGRPRCLVRATEVERIRFGAVPEAVWRGETFASADEFRQVHVACMPEHVLEDDTEFIALHFEPISVVRSRYWRAWQTGAALLVLAWLAMRRPRALPLLAMHRH